MFFEESVCEECTYRAYFGKVDLLVLEVSAVDLGGAAPPAGQLEPGEGVDAALVPQARA